jgi:hypothetical protein
LARNQNESVQPQFLTYARAFVIVRQLYESTYIIWKNIEMVKPVIFHGYFFSLPGKSNRLRIEIMFAQALANHLGRNKGGCTFTLKGGMKSSEQGRQDLWEIEANMSALNQW